MTNKIILVDPPWQYNDKSLNRGGAERHYPTMTPKELAALDVKALADSECALCMWVTMPHIKTAMQLISDWGFEYVTCLFVWVKTYSNGDRNNTFVGMGHHTRSNSELMLLARPKGKKTPKRIDASIRQVQFFPVTRHSEKPAEFRELLTRLYGDLPRVELFARESAEGWGRWGNEVDSTIELGPQKYKTIEESVFAMTHGLEVGISDYRGICPDCFSHLVIGGGRAKGQDGGGIAAICDCGYSEFKPELSLMKCAIRTTVGRLAA